ncbi:biopolymer transporter ExbD [bacterium]|nr:biopolymer transporter ExbD [bacterium]
MANINNNNNEITPQINMVPLIDILLVLLIIFMLTATVVKERRIPISLPKASTGDSINESKGFAITIDKDNNYFLNGDRSNFKEIMNKLSFEKKSGQNIVVAISADKNIKYSEIVETINGLREIEINDYALNVEMK